jgi:hypothetical protein
VDVELEHPTSEVSETEFEPMPESYLAEAGNWVQIS